MKKLLQGFATLIIAKLVCMAAYADGSGSFDSRGGTNDENTSVDYGMQMFYSARARSIVKDLTSTVGGTNEMGAFEAPSIAGCIERKEITTGDEIIYTLEENIKGLVSYGDKPVAGGDFLSYKNMYARVNRIDTPAIQVPGDMSQQRVAKIIKDIPSAVKRQVVDFMAEQFEFEFIPALLNGASPSLLSTTANGGLGVSLGNGAGGGAGVPLMNRWFYTPDTGFCTYSDTPATYNSTVNDAINGIDASADDKVTLNAIDIIRAKLDDIYFSPVTIGGVKVKAAVACDPDIMWRIKRLFDDWNKYAMPRGKDNPFFNTDTILYNDMMFFSWVNLKKYRPAYSAALGYPTFGPVSEGTDPRTYTTSSSLGLMMFMGARCAIEGYNGSIGIEPKRGDFGKSLEYAGNMKLGYERAEWYAKDGRASSVNNTENRSLVIAAFYEPGVAQ